MEISEFPWLENFSNVKNSYNGKILSKYVPIILLEAGPCPNKFFFKLVHLVISEHFTKYNRSVYTNQICISPTFFKYIEQNGLYHQLKDQNTTFLKIITEKDKEYRSVPLKIRYQVLVRQRWRCNTCGCILKFSEKSNWEGKLAHIDHVHPYAKRATYPKGPKFINEIANLQGLCYECNLAKQNNLN